ncbi:hypothetical protein CEE45_13735 [Candidatus Heimdallarchaeota archaeon B3_Heim]|nr:MAG: hypothetical protein CEE45_13735 [Candidatus Heimdallarchaeota archaeon B3_Heim]
MLNPNFWENMDHRLAFYDKILAECKKEEKIFSENQNKSERLQYEDKLDQFIQLKNFYFTVYFNIRSSF